MRRRKRSNPVKKKFLIGLFLCLAMIALILCITLFQHMKERKLETDVESHLGKQGIVNDVFQWPDFDVDLLTPNAYSRPQRALNKVNYIVVHYTANPGSTAKQNRDYFEKLKDSHETKASSHFVIGIDGKVVQCIPLTEISYASNERNVDSISIENCHPSADGKFSDKTYKKLVEMCAWLCLRYNLPVDHIIRHYDVTGKNCPKYFVEHPKEWAKFRQDVSAKMKNYPLMDTSKK